MITLGVTGGLGSGKSTACRFFADMGVPVFVADDEAKRLMAEDPELRADLIEAFGPETYSADGELNRSYLSARVFGDRAQLARINALVHPRVFEAFEGFRRNAESAGATLVIKEAAILFESGGDRHVDRTLLVDAPIATRIDRVARRDGMSRHDAMERMRHQSPAEELRKRADYVIDNDGDEAHLRAEVRRLYDELIRQVAPHA